MFFVRHIVSKANLHYCTVSWDWHWPGRREVARIYFGIPGPDRFALVVPSRYSIPDSRSPWAQILTLPSIHQWMLQNTLGKWHKNASLHLQHTRAVIAPSLGRKRDWEGSFSQISVGFGDWITSEQMWNWKKSKGRGYSLDRYAQKLCQQLLVIACQKFTWLLTEDELTTQASVGSLMQDSARQVTNKSMWFSGDEACP